MPQITTIVAGLSLAFVFGLARWLRLPVIPEPFVPAERWRRRARAAAEPEA